MYVNPFWFGVITTIIVEILACIALVVHDSFKGGKR